MTFLRLRSLYDGYNMITIIQLQVSQIVPRRMSTPAAAASLDDKPIQAPRSTAHAPVTSPNLVLAIVCVGIVLANLDLFIVNVALPNMGQDFKNATLEDLSWILNGYAIVYAALLVFFGRLAERHRRDQSFLLGVALFTGASAACAVANSVETLVIFRLAQAAGAALMTPTSLCLLTSAFPPRRRARPLGTYTTICALGASSGPPL